MIASLASYKNAIKHPPRTSKTRQHKNLSLMARNGCKNWKCSVPVQRLNGVTTIVAKRNNAALRKNEQAF
jgi:hypothetical protein